MKSYTLPARSLTLDDSWDVIVAGGGPAGCTAAMAAAREGARTLLIESTGSLGGSGTTALVPAWCPFSDKEKIIYRGLAEKVFTAAKAGMNHVASDALDWVPIDPERLKRVYDELVTEAGATVLFQTQLAAVEMNGDDEVAAIIISNKAGLSALRAKVYVDCTGDADLAAWAGADFQKGAQADGDMQPVTHCFILSNVNEKAFNEETRIYGGNPDSPIHAILKSGKYPLIPDGHLCSNIVGPGAAGFNAGHMWQVDNTDPAATSKALMHGRKMAAQYRDALAEFAPKAFGNAFLAVTGSVVGVRETRRIIGDYMLTLEDYVERRSFDDEICRNSYFIDVHLTRKESKSLNANDVEKRLAHYGVGESHGIPYRCLTPKGLKNVLVAGRSISCERMVHGSIRVMPVCLAMGEAAGLAAGLSVRQAEVDVHAIDTAQLRARLREEGGYLPELPSEKAELVLA